MSTNSQVVKEGLSKTKNRPQPSIQALLSACAENWPVERMVQSFQVARATVYRRLHDLEAQGLLHRKYGKMNLTDTGVMILEGAATTDAAGGQLNKIWPFLTLLPTPVHRALVVLTLALYIARRDNLCPHHNGSIIAFGPTMHYKSWIVVFLCRILKIELEDVRVDMQSVRGRGALVRLNGKGEIAYQCKAVSEKMVWYNETTRGERASMRDLMAILAGRKEIKVENNTIEHAGVPFLELNPLVQGRGIEEALGFDAPMIRRSFPADLTHHQPDSSFKLKDMAVLEEASRLAPTEFSKAQSTPLEEGCRQLLYAALQQCVRPEMHRRYVDPKFVLTAVAGLRGVLSDREATSEILSAVLEIYATVGFTYEDWQARIAGLLSGKVAPSNDSGTARAGDGVATEDSVLPPNPYDVQAKLLNVKTQMEKCNLDVYDDSEDLCKLFHAFSDLKSKGHSLDAVCALAREFDTIIGLQRQIQEGGVLDDEVPKLIGETVQMIREGLFGPSLVRHLSLHRKIMELNMDEQSVVSLRQQLDDAVASNMELKEPMIHLLDTAKQGIGIAAEVAARRAELQELSNTLAMKTGTLQSVEKQLSAQNIELAALKENLARLASMESEGKKRVSMLTNKIREDTEELESIRNQKDFYGKVCRGLVTKKWAMLFFSEALLNPDIHIDRNVYWAFEDFLKERRFGSSRKGLEQALNSLIDATVESFSGTRIPDDEVEDRKAEMIDLRRKKKQLEKDIEQTREKGAMLSQNIMLASILVAGLLKKEKVSGASDAALTALSKLLEIKTGGGFHINRDQALIDQFAVVTTEAKGLVLDWFRADGPSAKEEGRIEPTCPTPESGGPS